jgi:hypothetical protein
MFNKIYNFGKSTNKTVKGLNAQQNQFLATYNFDLLFVIFRNLN